MEKKQENEFKMKRLNNANKNYYITANTILSLAQRASEIFESSEIEEAISGFRISKLRIRWQKAFV